MYNIVVNVVQKLTKKSLQTLLNKKKVYCRDLIQFILTWTYLFWIKLVFYDVIWRALCWEKNRGNIPSIMTSDAEQGMAKLCIEFITSDPTQSATETDFTKIIKGNLSDKEINESTPKVSIE